MLLKIKKILYKIYNYIINIWNSDCPKCLSKHCVYLYYEDYIWLWWTWKNIYKCKKCWEEL
jgi:hypothetical protein